MKIQVLGAALAAGVLLLGGCATGKVEAVTGATPKAAAKPVRTGVFVGRGPGGAGVMEWVRIVNESPELALTLVDSEMIAKGALDQLDLFVMPGGSSPRIKRDLGTNGTARIKDFIRRGGGYVGTCAGCCLLLDPVYDQRRGIGVIPFYRSGSKGQTVLPVTVNEKGAAALGLNKGTYGLRYSYGPVLEPSTNAVEGAKFEVWATNAGDFEKPGGKPEMYGRAAIVGGTYGKGRVVVTSCHPEYYLNTRVFVTGAFGYVTGRQVTLPTRPRRARAYTVGYYSEDVIGVETAQTMLDLDANPLFDVWALTSGDIRVGALDHVDALVFPHAEKDLPSAKTSAIIKAFIARGGVCVGWGGGSYALSKLGGKPLASGAATLDYLLKEAKKER